MSDNKLKILYASAEVWPYSKVGGLGDVAAALPAELARLGHDVRVISPCYRSVNDNFRPEHSSEYTSVYINNNSYGIGLKKLEREGVIQYFIDNPFFFGRDHIYNYFDDGERFIAFCKGILAILKLTNWKPDIINCNDWQTALIPAMLRSSHANDPFFSGIASVLSIHNAAFQGVFPPKYLEIAGLPGEVFHFTKAEFHGRLNFLKAGVSYADRVNTVSKRYAVEITTPEFGEGLDSHFSAHSGKLRGILNGLDYSRFDPEADSIIFSGYNPSDSSGKEKNKEGLLAELGLLSEKKKRTPLIGMVSRLTWQKGFDLVTATIDRILKLGTRIVILGSGDRRFEDSLMEAAGKYRDRISVNIRYDPALARKIYAASDMMLIPSKYEPCGLTQMIAMRYGTVPVARETGGLADTIKNFSPKTEKGDGILFKSYSERSLLGAVKKAVDIYADPKKWRVVVRNAAARKFKWPDSAVEYEAMYREAAEAAGNR